MLSATAPGQKADLREKEDIKLSQKLCPQAKKCGSCRYMGVPYEEQLRIKQKKMTQRYTVS